MKRLLPAILAMVTLLPACATRVEGLFVKDDFRAAEIKRGGMVAGGVVGEPGKFDLQQSNDFSNVMAASLQGERKYLRVVPQGALFNALGEAKYTELMNSFAKADLDQNALAFVASRVGDARYLALARVDSNITQKGESETQATEYKDKSGMRVKQPGHVIRSHSRTMVVTMTIYDLASKSVAFTGHVTKSRQETNDYVKENDSLGVMLVKALVSNGSQYVTPEAPQTRDVLRDVFAGFGQNLPKAD